MSKTRAIVYLMRGLPGCGKSHRARRLAADGGIVLETDQYFYTQVGDDPASYDYATELLPRARAWNFERFSRALAKGISPIVVDRGNGLNAETQKYAVHAIAQGYSVEWAESDSPWWLELKVLLKYRQFVDGKLFDTWAERLADSTRDTHRVPADTIRHWMSSWRFDVTIEDILNLGDQTQDRRS